MAVFRVLFRSEEEMGDVSPWHGENLNQWTGLYRSIWAVGFGAT